MPSRSPGIHRASALILSTLASGLVLLFGLQPSYAADRRHSRTGQIAVTDIFGRPLSVNGITLVDWDGYMANPAIEVRIQAPSDAAMPAIATLSVSTPYAYFPEKSDSSGAGSAKSIGLDTSQEQQPVLISAIPNRGAPEPDYGLHIELTDANDAIWTADIPVHVVALPRLAGPHFTIHLDFSRDQTGFFTDPEHRKPIEQAAEDWAYYFADMPLDTVPAGGETTSIWRSDGFVQSYATTNPEAYKGYYLYVYGIHSSAERSGGEGSYSGKPQTIKGKALPLRRSGGLEVETIGNYNALGWTFNIDPSSWWQMTNTSPGELYSIVHHEMGHALGMNPSNTQFKAYKDQGYIGDPKVVDYYGGKVSIDEHDHLGTSVDPESGKGGFGNDWGGIMPLHRWWITKLDLLAMQSVGYTLRKTGPFTPFSFASRALATATAGQPYSEQLTAVGGIPIYNWTLSSGSLPAGLTLDPFSGKVAGTPTDAGKSDFSIRVQDYRRSDDAIEQPFTITVTGTKTN